MLQKDFPSVTKYMGSKTEVLDLIERGINYFDNDHEWICDLFSGSATLSAALRNKANVISNDIQEYSEVFANTYLDNYFWDNYPDVKEITNEALERYHKFLNYYSDYDESFSYDHDFTLEEFNSLEEKERDLIKKNDWNEFDNYYLFTKDYSGTYWSFKQCVMIDSYRYVIDKYKDYPELFNLLLSCLMYAMAYNSQSTGHYAQYRIPETDSSKEDILIYRRKHLSNLFERKYEDLKEYLQGENHYKFITMAETDDDCLSKMPERSLVYADPPYSPVHYSRFYHVLETLVKYDYPEVRYKGRYRTDRYQSDFCIRTHVITAFNEMFKRIKEKNSDMILSYTTSDANTIKFDELITTCCDAFNPDMLNDGEKNDLIEKCYQFIDYKNENQILDVLSADESHKDLQYSISLIKKPYNHSRMGRTKKKTVPVVETVIVAKYLNK